MTYRLPDGWKEVKLGNVTGLKPGYAFKGTDFGAHNEKVIKIGNIKPPVVDYEALEGVDITNYDLDKINDYVAYEGDFVFAMTGATIGKIGRMCHNEAYVNQRVLLFQPTEDINKDYLYYSVIGNDFQNYVRNFVDSQTAQANISAKTLSKYKFYIPELSEQAAIASTLSALDKKIELNNKTNDNLEAQAQALFIHWFVDFEFLDENGNPYKSSGGVMVESELGMIPEGWEVISLSKIAEYINGIAFAKYKPEKESDASLPVIKIRELRQGYTDDSSEACISAVEKKYHICDYDMIFSWSGSLLVDIWTGGDAILNQHLFKVVSKDYDQWFYYYWTKHFLDDFIRIAKERATTMGHIKRSHLKEAKVFVPDSRTYTRLKGVLEHFLELKAKNKKQNQTLAQLRDALLPKLMSGKIRIPPEQ